VVHQAPQQLARRCLGSLRLLGKLPSEPRCPLTLRLSLIEAEKLNARQWLCKLPEMHQSQD